MADFDSLDDVIYINGDKHNQCYTTTGISFEEFIHSIASPLQNILLLQHDFDSADFNFMSHFEYVEQNSIMKLVEDRVENYDEFCWVDFEDNTDLDELEPVEIASLLYLGHVREPLNVKPFFPILNNNYAYLASENGRYSKVYYKRLYDFIFMLCSVIPMKLSYTPKRKMLFFQRTKQIMPISLHLLEELLPIMEEGLIIDLSKKETTRKTIEIPMYRPSNTVDNFYFYEYANQYTKVTTLFAKLVFYKKEQKWEIEK